ncbi:type IV pilus twitching motility protein PilT [Microbacterium sp. zg-YB36]|uniref:type IV pilus twitching motility protein PilT n=1 Tax=Microbacterium sp. zg-YB36 TaxID=2969407 RepID=UPI00214CCE10|nr:type IV pilus twitching motility protein PilT [Microbacterium sp. zg-YB36]MDL5349959.1 type IV pilus twitching motility protein PilT [Microbacterium sp. zg-YB36]
MVADDDGVMSTAAGSRFDALMRADEVDPELRSFLDGVPGVTLPGTAPVAAPTTRRAAQPQAPTDPASRSGDIPHVLRAQHPEVDPEFIASIKAVLDLGASDLHLVAESTPVIRVDGELQTVPGTTTWDRARVRRVIEGFVSVEQMQTFEKALELDLAYSVGDIARFRVNIFQDQRGLGAALRIIPTQIKSVVHLGLPPQLVDLAHLPRGLVLVCGPTGSGKSTTLAAIIDKANSSRAAHIVTVEDPIEFLHHHKRGIINQREVGADTHSFSEALKHSLRQDPDIILVGEMRDLETISTALTAAETGHLVFATLHTQDAGQTIDRIIDVYPSHQQSQVRTQLAATLRAVVVQTLIRRSSGKGRAVATEVMFSTPAIQALIRAGKTHQMRTAIQAGESIGMHTLDQDLARLVLSGQIEHSQAIELAQDAAEFEQLVRNRGLSRTAVDAVVPEGTRQVAGGL